MKKVVFNLFIGLLFFNLSCTKESEILLDTEKEVSEDIVGIPKIVITTNNVSIPDEPKINGKISVEVDDNVTFDGNIAIELRGSSSLWFEKKQYGFETRDFSNQDVDVSLLNLPEEEDWILNAPYSDKSLLRNVLMYDISRAIGRYASRTELVELTLNNQYDGVYVLMEKLKRDKHRIAINDLNVGENSGEDLTGGYIIKIDKSDEIDETIYTERTAITSSYPPNNAVGDQKIYFLYHTPKPEEITAAQKEYIKTYMESFENALSGSNFTDPANGYQAYIDVDSFIDFFILNELSNNVDGFRLSTYLTKDKNKKLAMGPIWDFNLAFGNANYCGGQETTLWAHKFNERCGGDFWLLPFWWERLLEDPNFVNKLKQRWQSLRSNEIATGNIFQKIDTYVSRLTDSKSVDNNFQRWKILSEYVWPNHFIGNTYTEEITYLKNWIQDRLSWLDSAIMAL